MQILFLVSWSAAVLVAALPVVYFLAFGWSAREAEFVNKVRVDEHDRPGRLAGHEMEAYFAKFWSRGQAAYLRDNPDIAGLLHDPPQWPTRFWGRSQDRAGSSPGAGSSDPKARVWVLRHMFQARYEELIGRGRYVAPFLLLLVVVAGLTGLVVATALRAGYDQYVGYLTGEAGLDTAASHAGVVTGHLLKMAPDDVAQLDKGVLPIPRVHLSMSSLAAISGAYVFVLTQLIQQCRARTLVYSDLFGASLRLLISVPLGLSMSTISPSEAVVPFISFGLGAFPIWELRAVVRRLIGAKLQFDPRADDDETTSMLGVTQAVSDVLAEENITCAQQLADIDPVVLAVRTGLSFDYVLFLAAQSLVWCFLGRTAGLLGPLGYGDARAIWFLMRDPSSQAEANREKVFTSLATQLAASASAAGKADKPVAAEVVCTDALLLRQAFGKISLDPYTVFLVRFTSDLDA